jgi:hypothetical protein
MIGFAKEYVQAHKKDKQEASDWADCVHPVTRAKIETREDKEAYARDYLKNEGVELDIDKMGYNPGQRAVSKLCLNSLWGKFAQKTNQAKSVFHTEWGNVQDLVYNEELIVKDVIQVGEVDGMNMHEVVYMEAKEGEERINFNGSLAIGAMTTAQARLRLMKALHRVGKRALYCDTDSIVYVEKEGEDTIPLGNYFGDWTDDTKGDPIVEFVALCPKTYACRHRSGKVKVKAKGFKIGGHSKHVLNLENYKKLLDLEDDAENTTRQERFFRRDNKRKVVMSVPWSSSYEAPCTRKDSYDSLKIIGYTLSGTGIIRGRGG